jgi:hypothetical protein
MKTSLLTLTVGLLLAAVGARADGGFVAPPAAHGVAVPDVPEPPRQTPLAPPARRERLYRIVSFVCLGQGERRELGGSESCKTQGTWRRYAHNACSVTGARAGKFLFRLRCD